MQAKRDPSQNGVVTSEPGWTRRGRRGERDDLCPFGSGQRG